ncbi:hypothetical protein BYT27DRAFT_7333192 [Phlegmacium glaucopus]|nr:hypothetical protein BYT27DRAFT_7333192 [Phlegmacium glaucopus]
MTSTTDTYATQISALANDFDLCCAAAALFYWDDNHKQGFRVYATSIMREFVDGISFGRDPEGILFYSALSDTSSKVGTVYYNVFYNSETPMAIRVDFLTTADDSETRFASFLTKDANNIETNLLQNGSGTWGEQQIGTCSANMYKVTGSKTVTLTLEPIGKTATFDVIDNSKKPGININGVFHFNLIDSLKDTSVANYTSDRLLFYPSGNTDQLVGVFFPNDPIPIDDSHASNPPTATWK